MRVVIATAVYYPQINGVAVFSHNLAVGLAKRGIEVSVLCPSQTGKNYEVVEEGVKTVYLRSVQVKMYPDQIHEVGEAKEVFGVGLPKLWHRHGFRVSVFPELEVRRVLDEFSPDVVHVQVSDPIGLSVVSYARRREIPVVTTEHNQPEVLTSSFKAPKVLKRGANAVLSAYFRNRQGKSDFVTMPTEQAIMNLFSRGREIGVPVAAVSNGVDLANFRPGKVSGEIYGRYGLSREGLKVLYIGRVDPEKQVGKVIEAFEMVLKRARTELPMEGDFSDFSNRGGTGVKRARTKLPKIELVIVGDGVDRGRLEEMVLKKGLADSVRFLGKVLPPDLYELYKVGDVFATASEIETQGIVLIEAAASGLPLIAVDKGAVSEVCRDGENGFLCRAGEVREMAEAMEAILGDEKLRRKFSKRSLEIAGEHDFERTLDKFMNIYRRVIENKKK